MTQATAQRSRSSTAQLLAAGVVLVFISATLLLQFVASFRLNCLPGRFASLSLSGQVCSPALWPFLEYSMYESPHHVGDLLPQPRLVGILADASGSEVDLDSPDFGFDNPWVFQNFLDSIQRNDVPSVRQYVQDYDNLHTVGLAAIRLEFHPVELTEQGFVEQAPYVVTSMSVAP